MALMNMVSFIRTFQSGDSISQRHAGCFTPCSQTRQKEGVGRAGPPTQLKTTVKLRLMKF